ncbi:MAG: tRNA (adenosine(37)-N6)-threonylcarbamoyltransferase complex ATPase subunit type 1 TsaE [Rhodothermales bacterium]|nr:tRNA (adenosine(37)-N6)-threonylcarbamoyltransferase complex ATPase subunit type 1 TsaE [Rhodothermales bacterium]
MNSALEEYFPFSTSSVAETVAFGRRLGEHLHPGDVVALHGDLGTGKTHLVKGVAATAGVEIDSVSSPTFSIVNEYPGTSHIVHFDLYRIKTNRELVELGFEEYLDRDAIIILEWPEMAHLFLPDNAIHIRIEHTGGDTRIFRLADS